MNKRKLGSFALSVMIIALGFPAEAQQAKKVPRIGHLLQNSASGENRGLSEAFRQGLRELGYIDGKNVVIVVRSAESKVERLPELAAELVQLKVDLLLAGGAAPIRAVKQSTRTIPIVMTQGPDPIASGFIDSLARPGGNITGVTGNLPGLNGKRLELLKESLPMISHMALLWDPIYPGSLNEKKELDSIALSLGVKLKGVEIAKIQRWDEEFSSLKRQGVGGLLMLGLNFTAGLHAQISEVTLKNRLPTMWVNCQPHDLGKESSEPVSFSSLDLMCYSPNIADLYRRAATFVAKILQGAKPAELPVEQPMKFDFVINLKTAKQIGLTIPPEVLARATKLIK
jgi:putative ABC transport system substrate-binding protein